MRFSKYLRIGLLAGVIILGFLSCRKKDNIDSGAGLQLSFSTDTVFFDTVFATVGSITSRLVVYNPNDNKIRIASIALAGGKSSNYSLNINGIPATSVSDVDIPGGDSIYIFVRVMVDPLNQNTPYVVTDSLQFMTNGTPQQVKLVAWGRDANFYRKATLKGNLVWDSTRAHVIYESLRVDTSATLTILPGTKVYFHMNAYMALSHLSSLKSQGTLEHPVRVQGDRMDPYYKDLPGQWVGIYLEKGSKDHEFNYTYIKNGAFGLALDSLGSPGTPMLRIRNSIIQNMTSYGIYAYGSSVTGENCVIGDCGRGCFAANYGGEYDFSYLTVGNYWSSSVRQAASVYLSNYSYDTLGNKIAFPLTKALFTNAIIYGSNEEEIELDSIPAAPFSCTFDHAILRTSMKTTNASRFINCMVNKDPEFVDEYKLNYAIDSLSPAIKMGKNLAIPYDIRGKERGTTPALGAYEYAK